MRLSTERGGGMVCRRAKSFSTGCTQTLPSCQCVTCSQKVLGMKVGLRTFMSALLPSPRTPFWLTPHTATRRESSSSASECVPPKASCAQGGGDHGGRHDPRAQPWQPLRP